MTQAPADKRAKPAHPPQTRFPVVDNTLQVGGEPVTALAERADGRAFYAYDGALMRERVAALRAVLPAGVELHYAMKANPMPAVVNHMASLTDGLDVASARELAIALASGTDPLDISFAGPGKSDEDLAAAVAIGLRMEAEGRSAVDQLDARSLRLRGKRPKKARRS